MKKFPEKFVWGAATSAHQVEGNAHNNWSEWEKKNAARLAKNAKKEWQPWQQEKFPAMFEESNYISAHAADHYNRYEQDFDLAKEGGHNAHRFSIDWARIEPEEGRFDEEAIQHYVDVVKALRARGLEPFVTLWHWTHPIWLEDRGGVLAKDFAQKFAHYAHTMTEAFDDDVTYYMTLNEPMSVIYHQYVTGKWPHARKGIFTILRAYKHFADAHTKAYAAMKKEAPQSQVGYTEILSSFVPRHNNSLLDKIIVKVARHWNNERIVKMIHGHYDFLGVQCYHEYPIGVNGVYREEDTDQSELSDMGWDLRSEKLYNVIKEFSAYGVPIYVTEDGLADAADKHRTQFIHDRLKQIYHAIEDGYDVRGYFHWSLMDNFEWDRGYWPRFGLVEIDFETLERKPRPSFWAYKEIIERGDV